MDSTKITDTENMMIWFRRARRWSAVIVRFDFVVCLRAAMQRSPDFGFYHVERKFFIHLLSKPV
jgi:hypothetical protein